LSDAFSIQKRNVLSPLLFSLALLSAISEVEEKKESFELKGTHHLPLYAYDAGTESLLDASERVFTEANVKKTNFLFVTRQHTAGQYVI
jgi:hypothetical protein